MVLGKIVYTISNTTRSFLEVAKWQIEPKYYKQGSAYENIYVGVATKGLRSFDAPRRPDTTEPSWGVFYRPDGVIFTNISTSENHAVFKETVASYAPRDVISIKVSCQMKTVKVYKNDICVHRISDLECLEGSVLKSCVQFTTGREAARVSTLAVPEVGATCIDSPRFQKRLLVTLMKSGGALGLGGGGGGGRPRGALCTTSRDSFAHVSAATHSPQQRKSTFAERLEAMERNLMFSHDDGIREILSGESPPPLGEVTLVFTDIQASTEFWEIVPEAMKPALSLHNELLRRLIKKWNAYEVKTEGDSFMIAFPNPTVALNWTLDVQAQLLLVAWPEAILAIDQTTQLEALSLEKQHAVFKGLRVRIGMHTGSPDCERDPVTGRMDYFGPVVNLCARVSNSAKGGEVLVSHSSYTRLKSLGSLPDPAIVVRPLGIKQLKGILRPEATYSVVSERLADRAVVWENVETSPSLQVAAAPLQSENMGSSPPQLLSAPSFRMNVASVVEVSKSAPISVAKIGRGWMSTAKQNADRRRKMAVMNIRCRRMHREKVKNGVRMERQESALMMAHDGFLMGGGDAAKQILPAGANICAVCIHFTELSAATEHTKALHSIVASADGSIITPSRTPEGSVHALFATFWTAEKGAQFALDCFAYLRQQTCLNCSGVAQHNKVIFSMATGASGVRAETTIMVGADGESYFDRYYAKHSGNVVLRDSYAAMDKVRTSEAFDTKDTTCFCQNVFNFTFDSASLCVFTDTAHTFGSGVCKVTKAARRLDFEVKEVVRIDTFSASMSCISKKFFLLQTVLTEGKGKKLVHVPEARKASQPTATPSLPTSLQKAASSSSAKPDKPDKDDSEVDEYESDFLSDNTPSSSPTARKPKAAAAHLLQAKRLTEVARLTEYLKKKDTYIAMLHKRDEVKREQSEVQLQARDERIEFLEAQLIAKGKSQVTKQGNTTSDSANHFEDLHRLREQLKAKEEEIQHLSDQLHVMMALSIHDPELDFSTKAEKKASESPNDPPKDSKICASTLVLPSAIKPKGAQQRQLSSTMRDAGKDDKVNIEKPPLAGPSVCLSSSTGSLGLERVERVFDEKDKEVTMFKRRYEAVMEESLRKQRKIDHLMNALEEYDTIMSNDESPANEPKEEETDKKMRMRAGQPTTTKPEFELEEDEEQEDDDDDEEEEEADSLAASVKKFEFSSPLSHMRRLKKSPVSLTKQPFPEASPLAQHPSPSASSPGSAVKASLRRFDDKPHPSQPHLTHLRKTKRQSVEFSKEILSSPGSSASPMSSVSRQAYRRSESLSSLAERCVIDLNDSDDNRSEVLCDSARSPSLTVTRMRKAKRQSVELSGGLAVPADPASPPYADIIAADANEALTLTLPVSPNTRLVPILPKASTPGDRPQLSSASPKPRPKIDTTAALRNAKRHSLGEIRVPAELRGQDRAASSSPQRVDGQKTRTQVGASALILRRNRALSSIASRDSSSSSSSRRSPSFLHGGAGSPSQNADRDRVTPLSGSSSALLGNAKKELPKRGSFDVGATSDPLRELAKARLASASDRTLAGGAFGRAAAAAASPSSLAQKRR